MGGLWQMKEFRQLFAKNGHPLEDNDRPVQRVNDRIIYYRSEASDDFN